MRRSRLNVAVDAIAFAGFVFLTASGVVMRFLLPPGSGHRMGIWGLNRHDWGSLHYWTAVVLLSVLSVHVLLHWKWIVSSVRDERHELSGARLALGLIGLLAILALAAAPLLSPVQGDRPAGRGRGRHGQKLGDSELVPRRVEPVRI